MDETGAPIIVPLSKSKLVLVLLGSALFVVAGVWMWIDAGQLADDEGPLVVRAIGAACVVVFGFFGGAATRKLFDKGPGLLIDKEGIVDNASAIGAGRVPWSEITEISTTEVRQQKFVTIIVQDPEKYIDRGGFLKRSFARLNHRMYGSPIHISANSLKTNFAELFDLLTKHHETYGARR